MMMMMMMMFTWTVSNTAGFSEGKFHLERDNIAFSRLQKIYYILFWLALLKNTKKYAEIPFFLDRAKTKTSGGKTTKGEAKIIW